MIMEKKREREREREEDLDLSWTKEYIPRDSIHLREPMSRVKMQFIYIDCYSKIEQITSQYCPLDIFENDSNSGSVLLQSRLLQIIQSKRQFLDKRYKLDDILLYFITMNSNQLVSFVQEKHQINDEYLQSKQIPCDIVIPSSIFIFHSINTIYLIFREMMLVSSPVSVKMKSCLKLENSPKKHTKRVRICDDHIIRKTMKQRENINV